MTEIVSGIELKYIPNDVVNMFTDRHKDLTEIFKELKSIRDRLAIYGIIMKEEIFVK